MAPAPGSEEAPATAPQDCVVVGSDMTTNCGAAACHNGHDDGPADAAERGAAAPAEAPGEATAAPSARARLRTEVPAAAEHSVVDFARSTSAPAVCSITDRAWFFRTAASVPVHVNFMADEDEEDEVPESLRVRIPRWFRKSLRVETAANSYGGQTVQQRLLHFESFLQTDVGRRSFAIRCAQSLGFGNRLRAAEVVDMYAGTDMEEHAYGVVFVIKLGIALASYGYNSVDVEYLMKAVCDGMSLPLNRLDAGLGHFSVSFGAGPGFVLRTGGGLQFDKILACVRLAKHVSGGFTQAPAAIMVLEEILDRRKPYGQLIHILAFQCLCTLTALSIRMGTYNDAKNTALITPFTIAALKLCKHGYQVTELVDFMVPFATGMGASIVWRYFDHAEACHVATWYLAVLIDALPGGQLVSAAYEFQFSSIIYSTSRLVRALLQCMLLAIGVTVGWQFFGHNLAVHEVGSRGAIASLPPSKECDDPGANAYRQSHWALYFGVYNLPLLLVILVGANIRLRETIVPLAISYVSLAVYGCLTYLAALSLPGVVNNIIVISVAANLGCLHEYYTGTPPIISVLPVIFCLAPGTPTLVSILRQIHQAEGDKMQGADLWGDLVMQGLSYAIGLHSAQALWRAKNFRRARAVAILEHERSQAAVNARGTGQEQGCARALTSPLIR